MIPYSYSVVFRWTESGELRELAFNADKVVYDEGGDNSIRLEAFLDVDEMKVLDELEQTGAVVQFSFEPRSCVVGNVAVLCSPDVKDYYSDDGRAVVTWELVNNKAIVHLHRR